MSQEADPKNVNEPSQSTDVAVAEETELASRHDLLDELGIAPPSGGPVAVARKNLDAGGSVSFVLDVPYINRAETFYHDFFEMDIVFRAWDRDGKWDVTTEPVDWHALMLWGEYPALVCLQRPGWTIVLNSIGRGEIMRAPKLGDAEVPVSPQSLRQMRARALFRNYTVIEDQPQSFGFRDPFGVVWRLVEDDTLTARSDA